MTADGFRRMALSFPGPSDIHRPIRPASDGEFTPSGGSWEGGMQRHKGSRTLEGPFGAAPDPWKLSVPRF